MMRVKWKEVLDKLRPLIQEQCELIGGSITLRRAFYVAVSNGLIPNTQNYYVSLSNQLARDREHGNLPWDWLGDDLDGTMVPINDEYNELDDDLSDNNIDSGLFISHLLLYLTGFLEEFVNVK